MYNAATFSPFDWFEKWFGFLSLGLFWCSLVIPLHRWISSRNSKKSYPRPPGLKVPFCSAFGHLWTLPSHSVMKKLSLNMNAFILQSLAGHHAIFQKEGLYRIEIAYTDHITLAKTEAVEKILTSNEFLEKSTAYKVLHPWLGTGLLTSHGSKWKSRRKLLTYSFHFDILKDFLPMVDEQAKVLLGILHERSVNEEYIDISYPLTLCSLDIICETTLGVHVGAQTNAQSKYVAAVLRCTKCVMQRLANPAYHLDIIFRFSKLGRQFRKDVDYIHSFIRKVIQKRKRDRIMGNIHYHENHGPDFREQQKEKRKALLDLLLDLHLKSPHFTDEDIREEVDTFSFEGHDTTAVGMTWAIYLIGLHPEVQNKIHQELDAIYAHDQERPTTMEDLKEMRYLECVLKESQRLYPSVPMFGRSVHEDIVVCGYKIKKGSNIGVNTYLLHRDPDVFPDPEKFAPDRFLPENSVDRSPYAYIPFSAGPRNCIGQRFAIMEEKTVISNILRRFRVKSLDHRDKIVLSAEITLRPGTAVRIILTPRLS